MQKSEGRSPTSKIRLRLLGGFSLERPGQVGDGLSYEKGRALLAYVALASDSLHARRALASLLWPDLAGNAALANLRLVLLNLRQALTSDGVSCLVVEREALRFNASALADFDLLNFSGTVPACTCPAVSYQSAACPGCLTSMAKGLEYYRGTFLAGFSLADCPDFEEWLQQQREILQRHALALLMRLADCHERRGNPATALPFSLRYLEMAPWDEEGYCRAMRQLSLDGQSGAALAQYERCRRMLREELGVEPSSETRVLAERISHGHLQREASALSPASTGVQGLTLSPSAERRQVTVLYGELSSGETEDPDEASDLLYPAQRSWSQIVMRYGGHVVQTYTGGLLAYFGYPAAHENAAREALLAALAIVRDGHPGVDVRLGVHTGLVVSGGSAAVPDRVGTTTSLAIRLRLFVGKGEVAVSADTSRLVPGYFNFQSLGSRDVSGVSRTLEVFRLTGESSATHRLAAADVLTPLVGRATELGALMSVWDDAAAGHCHLVLLRGEAGIGKSRLLHAVKGKLSEHDCAIREVRCVPEFSQSPFQPLIATAESLLGFSVGDDDATKFRRLAAYLEAAHEAIAAEAIPLAAAFLSLPVLPPYVAPSLSAQAQREATLEILPRLLCSLAQKQPVLFVVEDLHWSDPSTLEVITHFVNQVRDVPMLVLMSARPEFSPPWGEDRVPTWILGGLEDDEVGAIISGIAPDLPPTVARMLVDRADGVPLFAEELAKIANVGAGSDIPASLQDLLAARLDATGTAKATAQLAATIGRDFDLEVLQQISPLKPDALQVALRTLELAGLIWRRDGLSCQFRHALIRDAAYQSQTRQVRQAAHRQIAAALLAGGRRLVRSHPEILARHFAAGEDFAQAIAYWLQAGRLAAKHAANREAMQHFRAGLQLVDRLPAGPDRVHLEFDLQNDIGIAAIAIDGYASREAASAHERAMVLCEQHAGSPDMFRAVWGLWASASSRSGFRLALELAQQLLRMAESSGDEVQLQQAHFALGNTHFWQGGFVSADHHLRTALARYLPGQHVIHISDFGEDLRITAASYLSWVQEFMGKPDEADRISMETVAAARRLKHPFSLAYALTFAALLQCRLQQPKRALKLAGEVESLAETHGFQLWRIGGVIVKGWARSAMGEPAGIAQIEACLEETRIVMGGVTLLVFVLLADAQLRDQRFADVIATVRQAILLGDSIDDRHVKAELLCFQGQALLGLSVGNTNRAAECFRQSLVLCRRQQAKGIELRVLAAQKNLLGE